MGNVNSRQNLEEVHGQQFAEAMDQEFDIEDGDIMDASEEDDMDNQAPYPTFARLLNSRPIWYIAGMIDGILVMLLLGMIFGYLP